MARDIFPGSHRLRRSARRREATSLQLETLEHRRVFSTSQWLPLADLDPPAESAADVPVAEPAVLVANGNPNIDAASLLAAGGPGDAALPGFGNVARSGENGTVVYLGGGWAITANHVGLTSSINFGGTWYPVDMSSVRQLKNADNSSTDLKMFRVQGDPPLPEILSSHLASAPANGHVFMIGNGLTRGQEVFWSVSRSQNPWVWTEVPEPLIPGTNNFAGVTITNPRTIRWGDNTVSERGVYNVGGLTVTGFLTQFDTLKFTGQIGQPNEAQASAGDSGGAVFSYVNGKWVLSGLMLAVSGSLSGQPSNTALYGNITLMIDLSAYRTQILGIVGVADRQVFYNQSNFDGNSAAINAADDLAIATDKSPYIPGSGMATAANVTSYVRGINGIMIDLATTHGTISAADFTFKVGNDNSPSTWANAPAPTTVSVRPGAGADGTDRVEIVWANGAIANQWLEVVVKGNDAVGGFNTNTGLAKSDVFFWGNKIGDSGSDTPASTFDTTSTDAITVFATIGEGKPITDLRDYNRDGQVTSTDAMFVFAHIGSIARIDIPSGGPFAPIAEPATTADKTGDSAVAFALSAQSAASLAISADKLAASWEAFETRARAIARVFSQWADAPRPRSRPVGATLEPAGARRASDSLRVHDLLGDGSSDATDDFSDLAWLTELSRRLR